MTTAEKIDRSNYEALGLDIDGSPKRRRFVTKARAEDWMVQQARGDPLSFMRYMTGDTPPQHHYIWMTNFFHPERRFINLIGPRFSAKSHVTIYAMAWFLATNPTRTCAMISVSADQAEKRLEGLKEIFQDMRFKNVFPTIQTDERKSNNVSQFNIWDNNGEETAYQAWKMRCSREGSNLNVNDSILAVGISSTRVIGSRFSGPVILDDVVNESFLSDRMQQKVLSYIKGTLIPCLTDEGRVWCIGTRWMIGDIYEHLEKNPAFYTITIPAIIYDNRGVGHSYWPSFWDLEKIERQRVVMDDDVLFRVMFMCDPQATSSMKFNRADFAKPFPEILPHFTEIYVTTDFAMKLKEQHDWNVLYLVGVDKDRNVFLLEGMRYKVELSTNISRIIQMAELAYSSFGQLNGILIEEVGLGLVFAPLLREKRPHYPLIPIHPKGDKGERADAVSHWMRQNRFFINKKIYFFNQIVSEWVNFPNHKHDDTLDAAGLLMLHLALGSIQARVESIKSPFML